MKPEKKPELLSHALEGLMSEIGEIADTIKKYKRYGQVLDQTNLQEEAGDVMYYLAMLMDAIDSTLDHAADANVRKLMRRYPEGYSDAHAALRLDKRVEVGYEY
ncbi:MAG: nucleoside triphosphate pyrophosphohydrolase family protein [Fluviibacter sp.]